MQIPEDLKQRYEHLGNYQPLEVAVTDIYVREWQLLIERIATAEQTIAEFTREQSRYASIEGKAHLQTIDERDAAEEALSQAYYLIKGESPQWSNLFGYEQALEDIDDAQKCFRAENAELRAELVTLKGVNEVLMRERNFDPGAGNVLAGFIEHRGRIQVDNDRLRAEVERLKAPVSAQEVNTASRFAFAHSHDCAHELLNQFLAARQHPPKEKTMQELSKEQIDKAAKAARVNAMGQPNWIGTDRHWDDIEEHYKQEWRDAVMAAAPHLQYAPAPVDDDAALKAEQTIAALNHEIDLRIEQGKGLNEDKDLFRAELAEYKKALGPVTDEEWKVYRFGASVTVSERGFADWLMASRRALLEKKPEPIDPLHGLTSKYMPETTKAVGLSLHDELIVEAFNRGRSEPRA